MWKTAPGSDVTHSVKTPWRHHRRRVPQLPKYYFFYLWNRPAFNLIFLIIAFLVFVACNLFLYLERMTFYDSFILIFLIKLVCFCLIV